jgi:hypothetical protein
MTDRPLRAVASAHYRSYLPVVFDNPAPQEEKATCNNCAMLPPPGAPPQSSIQYYRPDTKCCTYHPILPNYLVGAALADGRPEMDEGRRRLRARIAARVSVSPRWVSPPRKMEVLLRASWVNTMGRSLMLRCPLYSPDNGGCTLWPHWDSVCATFYCKHMAAADGEAFWRSVRHYLSYVERRLAIAAACAVIPGHDEPDLRGYLTLEDLEDLPPAEERYAALWGEWLGREEEHYLRCHEWVKNLSRSEFEAIVGDAELQSRQENLEQSWDRLQNPALPDRLVRHPRLSPQDTPDGILVRGYNAEPLILTRDLFDVVNLFDGKETVAELRARLKKESELDLPEDMLLQLHRYRVLVTPEQAATPPREEALVLP